MDFYPWLSQDGTLYLSLSLFSQFHCKKPVYELKDTPITGPWKKRNKLFKRAAILLERAVANTIKNPIGGDGFNPISSSVPMVSWESLELKLPPQYKLYCFISIITLRIFKGVCIRSTRCIY